MAASTFVLVGNQNLIFGADGVVSGTLATTTQDFTSNNAADRAEARDANGAVFGVAFYNSNSSVSLSCLFLTGGTPPKVGDQFTITTAAFGARTGYVTSTVERGANQEYRKLDLEISNWQSVPTQDANLNWATS